MVFNEPSFGRDEIAEDSVLNWPDVVVDGFTTTEPEGGVVLEVACANGKTAIDQRTSARRYMTGDSGDGSRPRHLALKCDGIVSIEELRCMASGECGTRDHVGDVISTPLDIAGR